MMCRAWILLPRESLSQDAIVLFSRSRLSLMLRHCQAARMVCVFASKQFEYVVRLNNGPSGTNGWREKNAWNFGLVPFVSSGLETISTTKQRVQISDFGSLDLCSLSLFAFFYVSFIRAQSSHQRRCDDDEDDKSIGNERNSMKKKSRSDYSVCDLKYTFFSYLSSSTRAIWQYFWIQFDRLSCNMTCNIFYVFMSWFCHGFRVCLVCLMDRNGLRTMPMIYYACRRLMLFKQQRFISVPTIRNDRKIAATATNNKKIWSHLITIFNRKVSPFRVRSFFIPISDLSKLQVVDDDDDDDDECIYLLSI